MASSFLKCNAIRLNDVLIQVGVDGIDQIEVEISNVAVVKITETLEGKTTARNLVLSLDRVTVFDVEIPDPQSTELTPEEAYQQGVEAAQKADAQEALQEAFNKGYTSIKPVLPSFSLPSDSVDIN